MIILTRSQKAVMDILADGFSIVGAARQLDLTIGQANELLQAAQELNPNYDERMLIHLYRLQRAGLLEESAMMQKTLPQRQSRCGNLLTWQEWRAEVAAIHAATRRAAQTEARRNGRFRPCRFVIKTLDEVMDTPSPKGEKQMNTSPTLDLHSAHKRYMAGESLKDIAAEMDIAWQSLWRQFDAASFPRRDTKVTEKSKQTYEPPAIDDDPDPEKYTGNGHQATPETAVSETSIIPEDVRRIGGRLAAFREEMAKQGIQVSISVVLSLKISKEIGL